jgi:hypothetical protein
MYFEGMTARDFRENDRRYLADRVNELKFQLQECKYYADKVKKLEVELARTVRQLQEITEELNKSEDEE